MDSTKPPRPIFCGFLTYEGLEEGPQWSLNYHTRVTSYLNIKHRSILYMSEKIHACAREEGSGGVSDLARPLMHKAWKMFSASAFQALDLRMSFFFFKFFFLFYFYLKEKKKKGSSTGTQWNTSNPLQSQSEQGQLIPPVSTTFLINLSFSALGEKAAPGQGSLILKPPAQASPAQERSKYSLAFSKMPK